MNVSCLLVTLQSVYPSRLVVYCCHQAVTCLLRRAVRYAADTIAITLLVSETDDAGFLSSLHPSLSVSAWISEQLQLLH